MKITPPGGHSDANFEPEDTDGATQPLPSPEQPSTGRLSGLAKRRKRPPKAEQPEKNPPDNTQRPISGEVDIPHAEPAIQALRMGVPIQAAEPGRTSSAPPPEIISPIIFMTLPYRPLPQRIGPSDGGFLVSHVPNYPSDPEFVRRMAAASDRATATLRNAIKRENITPAQVREVLQAVGGDRRAIAIDRQHDESAYYYGHLVGADDWTLDLIPNAPTDRHYFYYARAAAWAEAANRPNAWGEHLPPQEIDVSIQGALHRTPLSFPLKHSSGDVGIFHPTGKEVRPLINRAIELFAEVLNDRSLTEEQAMWKLGEAHYLMMHAQPFFRGTPSIVETLVDATLRARHGVGLSRKRENIEPFWEAIFTPGTMLSDYARNFRNFFE